MPDGEPIQYKVNAYSHAGALQIARGKGHAVRKVVDTMGKEMQFNESTMENDYVEHTLATNDINSKVHGNTVVVHSSNLDKASSIIKRLGLTHTVISGLNESTADDVEAWKDRVRKAYPQHANTLKFKPRDQSRHINAEIDGHDRSFGVYDIAKGKGHVLGEGTETGNIQAKLAAEKQEEEQAAYEASKAKAPTIQDVVSVLGNTVSVADQSSVQ
jgi:hypothetical protein